MPDGKAIRIINVPSDIDSIIKGKSLAPRAIHSTNFSNKLSNQGYSVQQIDALPDGPETWSFDGEVSQNGVRNEEANVQVNHRVKEAIIDATTAAPFQIIIGGGCSIVPAVVSGLWEGLAPKRIGLLYLDGDADLAMPGEPGAPLALASMTGTHLTMREGALESMKPFTRPDGSGVCDPSNTVFFGLNAALQGNSRNQLAYLMDEGFRVFTSSAVAKGPEVRARQALEWLERRVDCFLVHLDVDAIDGTLFPLANVANRTGVRFEQIMSAARIFLESEKAVGLVVAEVNPDHDPGLKMTGMLVDELVEAFKGRIGKA